MEKAVRRLVMLLVTTGIMIFPDQSPWAQSSSVPTSTWFELHDGSGASQFTAPAMRINSPVTWDNHNRVLVFHGGSYNDESVIDRGVNSTSLWAFEPVTRSWTRWWYDGGVVAPVEGGTGIPRRRHAYGNFEYMPDRKAILLYGGVSHPGDQGSQADTWEFDVITKTWTQRFPAQDAHSRLETDMVYHAAARRALVYGGLNATSEETWSYDPAGGNWSFQTSVRPDALVTTAMAYDSARGRVVLFGGSPDYNVGAYNDLWAYDFLTNRWTLIPISGVKPPPRRRHGFAYDSQNDVFLAYGGESGSFQPLTDTWIYNPRTNAWTQVSGSTAPNHHLVEWRLTYSPEYNVFLMVIPGGDSYPSDQVARTWAFRYAVSIPTAPDQLSVK